MSIRDIQPEIQIQCSACSKSFLSTTSKLSSLSEINNALCTFCKREQLQEQLRQNSVECLTAVMCPNIGCGIVIQSPELLNKHSLQCKFARLKCAHKNCSFIGTKNELIAHSNSCECYEIPCPHCGDCWAIGELLRHEIQCRVISTCDECGMHVPNSCKITHDAWLCTARNIWSFCNSCKTVINFQDLRRHRDSCPYQDYSYSKPESIYKPLLPLTLPYEELCQQTESEDDKDEYRPYSTHTPEHESDLHVTPITHEQLLSSLSEPGNDVKPFMRTSVGSYRPPMKLSRDVRAKWQKLMHTVDVNMEEYKKIYSINQLYES